ncbi:MAG: hypothetical protein M0030_13420 [Actinomycetota bacterium]|nr:hypothetical protein [Actinomycetota bacterium]
MLQIARVLLARAGRHHRAAGSRRPHPAVSGPDPQRVQTGAQTISPGQAFLTAPVATSFKAGSILWLPTPPRTHL